MESTIEELKFVADLAHNGGMMKAQNEALSADLTKLQTELNEKKVQLMEMQVMMAAKDEVIAAKDRRIPGDRFLASCQYRGDNCR